MEKILVNIYSQEYKEIIRNKKEISQKIDNLNGGDPILIQDPKILTKKLLEMKDKLDQYEKSKKKLKLGELKDTLQQFKDVSDAVNEVNERMNNFDLNDDIEKNKIINSIKTLRTDLLQNLDQDALLVTIKDKPVLIDAPIEVTKEQLNTISQKFKSEYKDIKTKLMSNSEAFQTSLDDIESKIKEIKDITLKYNNDIEFLDKNMKLLIEKTSEIEYSNNDISIVSDAEKNSIGPDIVSIDNYITDISRVKSSDIKANLDKALEQIQIRSTNLKDDDFEFPNQSDLPIISDPTFSQDIGVIYIDKSKKEKKIELQKKISDNNKEIDNLKKQLDVNNLQNLTNDEKSKIDFLKEYETYLDKLKFEDLKAQIEQNKVNNIKILQKNFNKELDDATIRQIIKIKKEIDTLLPDNYLLLELKKISDKFKYTEKNKQNTELKKYIVEKKDLINKIESEYYFIDNQEELLRIHNKVFKDLDSTTVKIKSLEQSNIELKRELETLNRSLTQLKGGKESQENRDGLKIIDDQTILLEKLVNYSILVKELKQVLAKYYKKTMEYNKLYIQVTFYQMFLLLSTTNQLTNKNTMMYKYISLGTCQYYRRILDILRSKMNQDVKSPEVKYFVKYHYILINKLFNFLTFINKLDKVNNQKVSKTSIIDIDKSGMQIKNMFHLLNLFKDILENYKQMFQEKVSIFARINDFANPQTTKSKNSNKEYTKNQAIDNRPQDQIIFSKDTERSDILGISAEKCENSLDAKNYIEDLQNKNNKITKGIQFAEVFDSKEFPDNDTLSLYMGLSSQLSQKKGTMLLTYGYSGVGKTVTLFGNKQKNIYGLLQRTLLNIKGQGKILFRVFELYGKGFKYFFYWQNLKNTHQFIYNYKFKKTNDSLELDNVDEIPDKNINSFVNQINSIESNTIPESYIEIDYNDFKGFDEIVDQIDNERKKTGRIKATVNNPSSSRSIVLYEFEILIDGTFVPFIVMDLPGKENIVKTFIDLDDDFDIYNDSDKDNLIRAAMYLDPMYLPTLDSTYSNYIIDLVKNNHSDIFNQWVNNSKYMAISLKSKEKVLNSFSNIKRSKKEKKENLGKNQYMEISGGNFNGAKKIDKNSDLIDATNSLNIQFTATELMKYLIENSYFNVIEEIIIKTYKEEKKGLTDGQIGELKRNVSGAFEGVYINENILGIITYIIKDVMKKDGKKYIETQKDPNIELKRSETQKRLDVKVKEGDELFTTTLDALTFQFRDFLRTEGSGYMNYLDKKDNNVFSKFVKPRNDEDRLFLRQLYLKIENSYNYSKTYKYEEPLIADILKPFLDKLENYYMFYLLTNNDPDFKCEKQMKLLDVSLKFIQAMNPPE